MLAIADSDIDIDLYIFLLIDFQYILSSRNILHINIIDDSDIYGIPYNRSIFLIGVVDTMATIAIIIISSGATLL